MQTKSLIKTRLSILLILLGVILVAIFHSCKKYPDGPVFSIHTKTQRLSNTWKVENYKINNTDYTSLMSNYTETFSKNGAYSYIWGISSGSGVWVFQNDDREIKLYGNNNQSSRTLVILRLEEKSLWYYYIDGNDMHELHMLPE